MTKLRSCGVRLTLLLTVLGAPATALSGPATPTCAELATDPAWGLAGNPGLTGLTAAIVPPTGPNLAYCRVDFTDVTLAGREFGYRPGQTSKFRIRVGLPLNANDGGAGGVQGAWNGSIQTLGNGGFAGSVSGVTSATNTGYVGTGTDTGHNASITNPVRTRTRPRPPSSIRRAKAAPRSRSSRTAR
jgi:hypothetical protein